MRQIFESRLDKGYIDLFEEEEGLYIVSGFARSARGVGLVIPAPEAADLAEALLRRLDRLTRLSVIEGVLGIRYEEHNSASTRPNDEVASTSSTS